MIVSDRVGCAEDLIYSQKHSAVVDAEAHSAWSATMQNMTELIQSPNYDYDGLAQHVASFNLGAFASSIKKHIHE